MSSIAQSDDEITFNNFLIKIGLKLEDVEWYFSEKVLEESYEEESVKQEELQRHLQYYRCLNMSRGGYCE